MMYTRTVSVSLFDGAAGSDVALAQDVWVVCSVCLTGSGRQPNKGADEEKAKAFVRSGHMGDKTSLNARFGVALHRCSVARRRRCGLIQQGGVTWQLTFRIVDIYYHQNARRL